MPVFLVADGTTATNAATSYASVLEADDYLSLSREYLPAWTALTTAEKQVYLMHASRLMDQTIKYTGTLASTDTNLRWPRDNAFDCDAKLYDNTEIPEPIKATAIEIAGYYATNTTINASDKVGDDEGLQSMRVDVLSFTWKKSAISASTANKYPKYIANTLQCLGTIDYRAMGQPMGVRFKQGAF